MKGSVKMDKLKYDVKEFEELFTESADPADRDKKKKAKADSKQKKSVQVIDGKRSMNGGIILARIKMSHDEMADVVDRMYVFLFLYLAIDSLLSFLTNSFSFFL